MQDEPGSTRVQLCGTFAVELSGRRVDQAFPGRQARLLFSYLILFRPQRVPRDSLVDALWGDNPPAAASAALNVLISKVRAAVGPDILRGRGELSVALPEPAYVDVEVATSALHVAESAVARQDWRRAWSPALTAQFVARRPFLPEADAPWAESWRRRLADMRARALECYASACLQLGGPELPGAERAARELLEVAPLRETGHLLLMQVLAARGNVAEALAAYERLRVLLRDELGVNPSQAVQDAHTKLLASFSPTSGQRCGNVQSRLPQGRRPMLRHRISPHRLEDGMGTDMATIDEEQVAELLGRFVNDLGATVSAGNVLIGDKLGLYQTLAEAGPLTPRELAAYTSTAERYVREWLPGQAAGGYISYDAETGRYSMTKAQALTFADPAGLVLPGAFQLAVACLSEESMILDAFRTGGGVAWGEHDPDVFTGCERFYRPGYVANLVSSWIPAVGGLRERLVAGIPVADVGCGLGASTRILADTYPASSVQGFDPHLAAIERARKAAAEADLADRCDFAVARTQDFPGSGYGLVATFDCLHDMGDPIGAARHIRAALSADGVWLIVEPYAGASVAENLTPVGRIYYSFSTFLCVPHAISEGADNALGNQAGETATGDVVEAAGFRTFRRVAETPFNLVYEARP